MYFIGGGELMFFFASEAKKRKLNVISIIAERHANEIINNKKLEDHLKNIGIVYKLKKLDIKILKKIIYEKDNFLFFSFDLPWIFDKKIISQIFENKLINTHSTRLPLYRGGGGFSWRIMNQEKV